jgi:DNA-binding response OmpR family regulator
MQQQSVYDELAFLRDRVAALEYEIARRDRDAISDIAAIMSATGLAVGLARMLKALATGQVMSRDRLAVLCCHSENGDIRLVDSQIKRLRQQLPSGVHIKSLYGIGYCIAQDDLDHARKFMKGEKS